MSQPPTGEPPQYGQPGAPEQPAPPPPPGPQQFGPPQQAAPPPQYGGPQYAPQQYAPQQYAPQQFGPQPYGQPPMGPVTTQFAKLDPGPSRSFGVISAAVTGVGALLGVLGFTAFDWFTSGAANTVLQGAGGSSTFSKIHNELDDVKRQLGLLPSGVTKSIHYGIAPAYFSWLGWTLLLGGVALALIGASPVSGFSEAGRTLGVLAGIAGVGATFGAIYLFRFDAGLANQLNTTQPGYLDYLKHASVGFFLAVGGFVLVAVGAAMGPNRS